MNRHDRNLRPEQRRKIRELNDQLRKHWKGGNRVYTRAILDLDFDTLMRVEHAIETFDGFNRRNDPWGEHDSGKVMIDAVPYFWRIDYRDLNLEGHSPDPSDETVTLRVLTVATADEI